MKTATREIKIKGIPVSRGIGIGKAFFFTFSDHEAPDFMVSLNDIDSEVIRYQVAVEKSHQELLQLQLMLKGEFIDDGAEILDTHLQIMKDPLLTSAVENEIRQTRKNAQFVFQELIKKYQKRFQSIKDPFFRERFKDIQDVSRRVASYLCESVRVGLAEIPQGSIVIAKELSASEVAEANAANIYAFVTENGGATSHAAIVAKAKGIPCISSVNIKAVIEQMDSKTLIVDARMGEVILNPEKETLTFYKSAHLKVAEHLDKLRQEAYHPAETYDGYQIKLSANLEMISEIEQIRAQCSHGVGLFRSEYIFLSEENFPSEDAQYAIYKEVVEKLDGLPIVIRTFDVGGDKQLKNQAALDKRNPFLGCRALRYLLNQKEIFKSQLRAILRVAKYGQVSILFPMVSTLPELLEAKALLEEARQELLLLGHQDDYHLRIGCMIEVPSAAIISDLLASECDFLSIGTNDLIQYSLAVDRGNHSLQKYYSPAHPGIIRLIKMVITEANHHSIPVSVCGEIASDPRFTPLLLGLGVDELSLSSRYVPAVKKSIRSISLIEANRLTEKVLALSSSEEIMDLLTQEYRNNVPEDCFFNC